MNITLKNTKTAKTTTGIYLEVALLDKLNTIDIELIEKQILLESKKYDLIF